jgi:hypothetical protein
MAENAKKMARIETASYVYYTLWLATAARMPKPSRAKKRNSVKDYKSIKHTFSKQKAQLNVTEIAEI